MIGKQDRWQEDLFVSALCGILFRRTMYYAALIGSWTSRGPQLWWRIATTRARAVPGSILKRHFV